MRRTRGASVKIRPECGGSALDVPAAGADERAHEAPPLLLVAHAPEGLQQAVFRGQRLDRVVEPGVEQRSRAVFVFHGPRLRRGSRP